MFNCGLSWRPRPGGGPTIEAKADNRLNVWYEEQGRLERDGKKLSLDAPRAFLLERATRTGQKSEEKIAMQNVIKNQHRAATRACAPQKVRA